MEQSEKLRNAIEFELRLNELIEEFEMSKQDVIDIIDPASASTRKGAKTRRKRVEKTYQNPHTGEKVISKGGNNKVLNSWKAEFGSDTVNSWLV